MEKAPFLVHGGPRQQHRKLARIAATSTTELLTAKPARPISDGTGGSVRQEVGVPSICRGPNKIRMHVAQESRLKDLLCIKLVPVFLLMFATADMLLHDLPAIAVVVGAA